MEFNYEKKYAYAEVDYILKWLGQEYISKIPNKVLQFIKEEKKFAYRPEIDFAKPIENQVRQETKNIIAYLNYNYWAKDEKEKKWIKDVVDKNAQKEKERRREERAKEIQARARIQNQTTVTGSIEQALKNNLNNN